jgi:DNA-binding Lrp family transcriptional regulator
MKNSRVSDRELAKALGVSQPTNRRTRTKLEREGIIKEYTLIPDFRKLGYELMGVTFIGREPVKKEENAELRKAVVEIEKENPYASLMAVNGTGLGKGTMFITLYRNYARYSEAMQLTRSLPHADAGGIESFLVDLNDESNYRLLTLEQVARLFKIRLHSALFKRFRKVIFKVGKSLFKHFLPGFWTIRCLMFKRSVFWAKRKSRSAALFEIGRATNTFIY